jgi:hypothetical protein
MCKQAERELVGKVGQKGDGPTRLFSLAANMAAVRRSFSTHVVQRLGWLVKEEFANTSALTIERITLRLHKLGHFPEDAGKRVFNRIQKSK